MCCSCVCDPGWGLGLWGSSTSLCTSLSSLCPLPVVYLCVCSAPGQVGAEIVKKALTYPLKLIAENAGTNGSVVMQRVIDSQDPNYGYNAAIDKFEDLMQSGIIDPT